MRPTFQRNHYQSLLSSVFCFVALLAMMLGVRAADVRSAPLAGTAISNQATAQFWDPATGYPVTITSNPVHVIVQPQEALVLHADRVVQLGPGAPVYLAHQLTNTGNTPSQYTFDLEDLGGDYHLDNIHLYQDLNGNGWWDSGEPEIKLNETVLPLNPNESLDVVVAGVIPVNTAIGSSTQTKLTVTTQLQELSASNTDTVKVVAGAAMRLQKEADRTDVNTGDILTYTVNALSIGIGAPTPITVNIDGAAQSRVVIRDVIPANTVFTEFDDAALAPVIPLSQKLYHVQGQPKHDYQSTPPANLAEIDAIALGVANWQPDNLQARLRFSVKVLSPTTPRLDNTAEIYFDNPNTPVPSNTVRTNLKSQPPTIRYYTDDTLSELATYTRAGNGLHLKVEAATCNEDPTVAEWKKIAIVSQLTGDSESYDVKETGPNTGIFRPADRESGEFVAVPTEDVSNGANAAIGDAVMQTLERDRLRATFVDCANQTVYTDIWVDPAGVVFDARGGDPVANAVVTVWQTDASGNKTGAALGQIITDATGIFSFVDLQPGNYLLEVTSPDGAFEAPSQVPPELMPLHRHVDRNGSYQKYFSVPENGAINFDVPVDFGPPTGLGLKKDVSNSIAEIGDFLQYRLELENGTGVAMSNVEITDHLPQGFALVPGSVRWKDSAGNFVKVPDPQGAPGPSLTFILNNYPPGPYAPGEINPGPNVPPTTTPGPYPSGTILVGNKAIITYRVRVGAAAGLGDAVNRAAAHGDSAYGRTDSNVASARVEVQSGVFTTRGIIIGKVFVDRNNNGIQDKGEEGIPGVRIWLENGTYAITDSEGKYSIYGLSPRTHVAKVDTTTMPAGSRLSAFDYNHAGSGSSSFADLRMGGMVKANFAIIDPSPQVLDEIAKRRESAAQNGTSLNAVFNNQLQQQNLRAHRNDVRGQSASGVISNTATAQGKMTIDSVPQAGIANTVMPSNGLTDQNGTSNALGTMGTSTLMGSGSSMFVTSDGGGLTFGDGTLSGALGAARSHVSDGVRLSTGGISSGEQLHGTAVTMPQELPLGAGNSNLPTAPVRVLPKVLLEDAVRKADNTLAFINLRDGDILPLDQSNISIKGAAGAVITLRVNGKEVSESRIGKKMTIPERLLEAREYIGVPFIAGQNTLELVQTDVAGNPRGQVQITVKAPGKLGGLQISTTEKTHYADGRSAVKVQVRLTDDKGVPVTVRTPLTLQASAGEWQAIDVNPLESGVQVFLEGGEGTYLLRAPLQPGDSIIKVTSGILGASMRLRFAPELRPLVGAGIVEMRLGNFRVKDVKEGSSFYFDEQLRSLAGSDKSTLDGRTAMFFKGRIKGEYLLTMRYDSQPDEEDRRLFRDIQPDEYYPIYGDSSVRGYDAQSTSRLYVRIDKNKSYVLYGDYTTPAQNLASALGQYNRSLTGGKLHHETKRFVFDAYASHDSSRQVVDEIAATGTSGPYLIPFGGDVVRQSEKVELVVRDRNQPSVILRVEPQTRFSDYMVDGLTNGILFRSPVPSRDADLNPVFIRVTYEVDDGGPRFFVGGLSAQLRVTSKLILGGSYAQAKDPIDPFSLASLNAQYKVTPNTLVIAEVAQSDLRSEGRGRAGRIEILHEDSKLQARALIARSDENFSNPSSLLSSGQEQAALRASYALNSRQRVLAEAIYTHDLTSQSKRRGVALSWEQVIAQGVRLQLGMRHVKDTDNTFIGHDVDFTSLRARLTGQLPRTPVTLFTEYERAISGDGQALTVGGDYQFSNRSRFYFRHRLIDSLAGLDALDNGQFDHSTVIGVDTAYMKNGRVFSEYRINDGIDGRGAEAAIGLRNLWTLSRAIRIGTSFERVKNLGGGSSRDSNYLDAGVGTAGAVALEYLPRDNFKATARVEVRRSEQEDSYLGSLGVAYKASRDWTFLARGIVSDRDSHQRDVSDDDEFDIYNGRQLRLQIGAAWRQTDRDKWNALAKYEYRTDANEGNLFSAFRQRAHIVSLDVNHQLNPRTDIGLHYAWKYTIADGSGLRSSGSAQLLSGRITHDIKKRYQVSLLGGLFRDGRAGDGMQGGLAAEVGFRIKRDMTIGLGYSLLDVEDDDLGLDFNKRGPYLRWRWKFDENLFGRGANTEDELAGQGRGVALQSMSEVQQHAAEDGPNAILSDEEVLQWEAQKATGTE